MFSAFFQHDRNIGDEAVIVEAAAAVGLDRAEVEQALASQERYVRQLADQQYAVESVGVTAVPSFRVDGRLYSGVLNADQLTKAVDDAAATGPLS